MKNKLLVYMFSLIIIIFTLYSCNNNNNKPKYRYYIYKTSIEIKYIDNSIDTILDIRKELFYRSKPNYEIKTSVSGFISETTIVPCLIVDKPYRNTNVACYIKTFKIINQIKEGEDKIR